MLCGNRLMVPPASRLLKVLGRFAGVPVRVIEVARHRSDQAQVRDRTVTLVIRRDLVVVQVEAALRPRVRQEAEAGAAVRRHRVLQVTEVEMDALSRRIRRLEAARVVVVVDRVVVPLVVRLFLQDRRAHLMILPMSRTELVLESLRTNVVR
jgi:hypothetical protein